MEELDKRQEAYAGIMYDVVRARDHERERLLNALKGMTDLWENIGKSIPPLLNEEAYKAALAILKEE